MPIYEYECPACSGRFEALVPFAERDSVACEQCGRPQVTRLASTFSATGVEGGSAPSGGHCCAPAGCGHCGH